MVERHTILTDDTFYHSKYVDMIQRYFGIKNLRKESQNKNSKFYGQYEILKDIFQTFILVFNCFFSDSNVGIETQANEARVRIDELIYKNDISQKRKYSPNAIKNLCDKRARRLYNLMVSWRNDDLLNIVANKTKILDRLYKDKLKGLIDEEMFKRQYNNLTTETYNLKKKSNELETKDKDFKNEVADTICDLLLVRKKIRAIRLYFKVYIEPILNELHNQDKIIYNMLSNDKTILETSEKVKTILSSFLGIISSDLILNNDDEIPTDDMLKSLYLVFFTDDNIEVKKELAKEICEDFINFYNENDFTQLSIEDLQERLNDSLFVSE